MRIDNSIGSMNPQRLAIAFLLAVTCAALAPAQNPAPSATALVNMVVANELADRVERRKWIYTVEKLDGKQKLTEEQVETKDGPIYRMLAIDGVPLNADQRQQDNARIDRLLRIPSEQLKVKRAYDQDEQKLESLMRLMPAAFLYEYDGGEGSLVRIKFRPNPNYSPSTYEARIVHSLAGSILIDAEQKRLAKLSGQLIQPVEFGFGLLGRIDNGGTVLIGRVEVGPSQWKTALIDIQMSGRLVIFKTINKRQHEVRSNFRPVPGDLSFSQANDLTISSNLRIAAPALRHADPEATLLQIRLE